MLAIDLKGKTALVCGSTGGIGKAIAHELAKAGATVVLLARNEEKLKEVKAELNKEYSQDHSYYIADFADNASVKKAADKITQEIKIDILINNTGGPPAGPAIDANVQDFVTAFQNHLLNNQILVQGVVSGMKSAGYGRIINIISTSVKQPIQGLGVSNTIRGAVANWSKTLATELAPWGITVNNILPGATATDRLHGIIQNKSLKTGKSAEEIEKEMLEEIPSKRFASPNEPAYAAVFLSSPLASYITGTNVVVDGGRTACL